jgi:hypothetical protein
MLLVEELADHLLVLAEDKLVVQVAVEDQTTLVQVQVQLD